jgi:hypothetical protein
VDQRQKNVNRTRAESRIFGVSSGSVNARRRTFSSLLQNSNQAIMDHLHEGKRGSGEVLTLHSCRILSAHEIALCHELVTKTPAQWAVDCGPADEKDSPLETN